MEEKWLTINHGMSISFLSYTTSNMKIRWGENSWGRLPTLTHRLEKADLELIGMYGNENAIEFNQVKLKPPVCLI